MSQSVYYRRNFYAQPPRSSSPFRPRRNKRQSFKPRSFGKKRGSPYTSHHVHLQQHISLPWAGLSASKAFIDLCPHGYSLNHAVANQLVTWTKPDATRWALYQQLYTQWKLSYIVVEILPTSTYNHPVYSATSPEQLDSPYRQTPGLQSFRSFLPGRKVKRTMNVKQLWGSQWQSFHIDPQHPPSTAQLPHLYVLAKRDNKQDLAHQLAILLANNHPQRNGVAQAPLQALTAADTSSIVLGIHYYYSMRGTADSANHHAVFGISTDSEEDPDQFDDDQDTEEPENQQHPGSKHGYFPDMSDDEDDYHIAAAQPSKRLKFAPAPDDLPLFLIPPDPPELTPASVCKIDPSATSAFE
jgi:hypothetical protein